MRYKSRLLLLGCVLGLTLAGCGRFAFEQREAWRREAEVACLQSGAVQQTSAIVPVSTIDGPGVCGADYPFKVAALGERTILGYAGEARPPASIPREFGMADRRPAATPAGYGPGQGAPLSTHPPDPEEDEEIDPSTLDVPGGGPGRPSAQSPGPVPPISREPSLGAETNLTAAPASVTPVATLACPIVSTLDRWVAASVQPAAQRWFGQQVVEIKQISAYSCRGINGARTGRLSEHAFGNALDIAAFTLADGRRVTVVKGWHGEPEEQGFLRDVHASACQHFSTVLAPGSNRFHYDHIHVDLARRRSGRSYCKPYPIPGDQIASRRGGPLTTGSIGTRRLGYADGQAQTRGALPRAVPGED